MLDDKTTKELQAAVLEFSDLQKTPEFQSLVTNKNPLAKELYFSYLACPLMPQAFVEAFQTWQAAGVARATTEGFEAEFEQAVSGYLELALGPSFKVLLHVNHPRAVAMKKAYLLRAIHPKTFIEEWAKWKDTLE